MNALSLDINYMYVWSSVQCNFYAKEQKKD